jgi:hypothetical protein
VNSTGRRSGEFFAPLPLGAVGLMIVNDRWLKPWLHSELTGKLSDIAICFFLPLFLSELLGLAFGLSARVRLWIGAVTATVLFASLEVVDPVARLAVRVLGAIGPGVGIARPFRMTSDWTDLLCLALVPVAASYGWNRLNRPDPLGATSTSPETRAPAPETRRR